jgi:predicted DCC family thiol-disulfide oxidoreductase YuxK
MARWVRRRVPAGRVLALANQRRGVLTRYGLTRAEADEQVWLVDRDGRRTGGADAINRVMAEAGGAWRLLSLAYRVPPMAAAQDAFYRWFARHRSSFHRFGITPECDEPGADCE